MLSKLIDYILKLLGIRQRTLPVSLSSKKEELESKLEKIEKEKSSTKDNIDYINKR